MKKKVIIIGGGLAGLSAGCYAAVNGFDTQIFEHHSVPGGVAAAWKRNGYLIDGGIHFVMGYKPRIGMHKLLTELGAADPLLYTDMQEYGKFIHEQSGKTLVLGSDLDKMASQLKQMAPEDSGKVDELFNGAKALRGHDLSTLGMNQPPELASIFSRTGDVLKTISIARYFSGKYIRKMSEFSSEIQNPWLKDLLNSLFLPESPLWFIMLVLALLADKQIGYLSKGCLSFVLEIEKQYKRAGGNISFKSTVEKVLVRNDKAVGVKLEDGREFEADYVISCGDSYKAVYNLLKGDYVNKSITLRHETWPICRPYLTASFGVKREFKNEMVFNNILLDNPVTIGDEAVKFLLVRIFNYSPDFAPSGKSVFQIEAETGFDYWFELQKTSRADYERVKLKTAGELLSKVEKYFPEITSQVELTDVATPYTTWRYTLNRKGSWGGWLLGADNILEKIERRLPGLGNFYLAGHWVMGGVPGVLFSGRQAVQLMCHDEGRKFISS